VSCRLPVTEWEKLFQDLQNIVIILSNILLSIKCIHLYLFSLFNAYDSQVWSFDGVAEFLHIPFTAHEFFD
jgi:hypothetical protein